MRSPWLRSFTTAATLSLLFASAVSAQTATVPPRPTPSATPKPRFPTVALDTLPNGLRIAVVESHDLPVVAVRMGMAGGFFLDPKGKEGLWTFMTQELRDGTLTRTPAAIVDAAADLGTTLQFSPAVGVANLPAFTTRRSSWEAALAIAADIVIHPAFPADGFTRQQSAQVAAASRTLQLARSTQTMFELIFGRDQPSGGNSTPASLRRITRDDVLQAYDQFARPQNAYIVVAGDITRAEARAAVARAFGDWKRGGVTISATQAPVTPYSGPTTIFLAHDSASTAAMTSGVLLPDASPSDMAAFEAFNVVAGGLSGLGRMWKAFRGERGLTYSPATTVNWRGAPQRGFWYGRADAVPAAKTDTAVTEWLRILREIETTNPISAAELDAAKTTLTSARLRATETVDGLATGAFEILRLRLPADSWSTYADRVGALTLDQVRTVTSRYIDPGHLAIVVTGDTTILAKSLRATGIPVVIVDR